jgi:hypothetical protein
MIVGPSVLTSSHMNLSQSTGIDDGIKDIRPFIMCHGLILLIGKSHDIKISPYQNW